MVWMIVFYLINNNYNEEYEKDKINNLANF